MSDNNITIKKLDRDKWTEFPIGTKVHATNGGNWEKIGKHEWKWLAGSIFPNPGADWNKIELPFTQQEVDESYEKVFGKDGKMFGGLTNCKHEEVESMSGIKCKNCGGWYTF